MIPARSYLCTIEKHLRDESRSVAWDRATHKAKTLDNQCSGGGESVGGQCKGTQGELRETLAIEQPSLLKVESPVGELCRVTVVGDHHDGFIEFPMKLLHERQYVLGGRSV